MGKPNVKEFGYASPSRLAKLAQVPLSVLKQSRKFPLVWSLDRRPQWRGPRYLIVFIFSAKPSYYIRCSQFYKGERISHNYTLKQAATLLYRNKVQKLPFSRTLFNPRPVAQNHRIWQRRRERDAPWINPNWRLEDEGFPIEGE
ncbi:MAG: hypothetical protein ACRD22_03345 [Terriglobia bacterium]